MELPQHIQTIGAAGHSLAMTELRPLSNLGDEEREPFLRAWKRISEERRLEIIRAMIELTEENIDLHFADVLLWVLEDGDSEVRAAAAAGLWEDERPATIRRLLTLLRQDGAESVRAAAGTALARASYMVELDEIDEDDAARVKRALLAAIRSDRSDEVRRRALESAGFIGSDDEIMGEVQLAYERREQLLTESALTAMGRSMLPRWLPLIARELDSRSPATRYEAARAAGELADEARSLSIRLASLAADDDGEVASVAIWALGQVGGAAAQRALDQLRTSQNETRRQAALDAIDELSLGEGFLGGDWRKN